MKNKNNMKNFEKQNESESDQIKTLIKIFVGVVIFFVLAYFLMGIITGEIKLGKDKTEEVQIQYDEILAERTFKQKETDYFVAFYNFSDEDGLLDILLQDLGYSEKVYKVNLDKKFNSTYIGKVNSAPTSLENLKVSSPTLIKITKGKAKKVVNGVDSIKKYVSDIK